MATRSPTSADSICPTRADLAQLLRTQGSSPEQVVLADHVGDCTACQQQLDELASAGDPHLTGAVRHIDQSRPASNSAFWKALQSAEVDVTQAFDTSSDESLADLKLDFLQPADAPGRLGKLGSFEILRVIGRGGMGIVLHAFDPSLSRDVAIKILDPQLASNELAMQRFTREARAAAAVTHDNIVAVHQVNQDENSGLPYLVMQLVNGESLEQRLLRVGRLPVPDVIRIGMQAAAGLASAHEQGLIHRDVKPGNILIEAGTDKVKLTDFGLARATEDMKLTRTGFVAGTPLYMAPEQARGDEIDHRVDLFSLGSVLYESLAGRPPFDGKTPLAVLRRVADEAHTRLRRINPTVPDWLEDTIDQLLEKDPNQRFATAQEVSEVFAHHLHQLSPGSPLEVPSVACGVKSTLSKAKRRHFCLRTAATLATVFLAGGVIGGVAALTLAPNPEVSLDTNPGSNLLSNLLPSTSPSPIEGPAAKGEFRSNAGGVWTTALSPDGTLLATGLETGRISVWDVARQALKFDLHADQEGKQNAHMGPVWTLEFSTDGKQLVSAGDDGLVITWDLQTSKKENSLPLGRSIRAAAITPTTSLCAIGDQHGTVQVFDLMHDTPIHTYLQDSPVNAVAFSTDGNTIASAAANGVIIVSDIPTNRRRLTLTGHTGPVYSVAFSSDGDRLVSTGWDRNVIVWDLKDGTQLKKLEGHDGGVLAASFTPCGRILATVGQDGKTRVWNSDTGELLQTFARHRGPVHTVRFDRIGGMLITGGKDGRAFVWDTVECKKSNL